MLLVALVPVHAGLINGSPLSISFSYWALKNGLQLLNAHCAGITFKAMLRSRSKGNYPFRCKSYGYPMVSEQLPLMI